MKLFTKVDQIPEYTRYDEPLSIKIYKKPALWASKTYFHKRAHYPLSLFDEIDEPLIFEIVGLDENYRNLHTDPYNPNNVCLIVKKYGVYYGFDYECLIEDGKTYIVDTEKGPTIEDSLNTLKVLLDGIQQV